MDLCDNSSLLFWSHARKQLLPKFLATNQSVSHKAHTQAFCTAHCPEQLSNLWITIGSTAKKWLLDKQCHSFPINMLHNTLQFLKTLKTHLIVHILILFIHSISWTGMSSFNCYLTICQSQNLFPAISMIAESRRTIRDCKLLPIITKWFETRNIFIFKTKPKNNLI